MQEYPSYEEIIKAARSKSIYIFCVDEPPAMYYMYKYGIENDYRFGFNLDSGQFHRAVHKGNTVLLNIIEKGFDQISDKDYEKIDKKWMGKKLRTQNYQKYLSYFIIFLVLILIVFINQQITNHLLKKKIAERTQKLETTLSELKETESRNKALLNANPDLMFLFSSNGDFLDYKAPENSSLYAPPEVFMNKNIRDVLPPDLVELTLKKISDTLTTGLPQNYEYSLVIEGKTEFFDSRMVLCGDNEILAIIRYITEKKQAEEERSRANKLDSIGILAGGIAHDFNNILTAILGSLSLIKIRMSKEDSSYFLLDEAEKACFRAKNLTGQLLTFAKGGAPVKENSDINEIIRDSSEFVLRGSSCSCSYVLSDSLFNVEVDKGQISQVIQNLIINAAQSMPTGGVIKIFTSNVNLSQNNSLGLDSGSYIMISVKDDGCGIEDKDLKSIFDPYFTTKHQGSGLGLTICYSIIKNHNGAIEVKSQPGFGSTFNVYLPNIEHQQAEEYKKIERKLTMTNDKLILFMDDEMQLRIIGGEILSYLGYKVEFAEDGEEAINKITSAFSNHQPYDLVIMDLTVPGKMGGKEAINIIHEKYPKLKVLVTSGYSNDPVMSNYKDYGFYGVVLKPFDITALEKAVTEALRS